MDALSDVLRVVHLSGAVYLNAEFTAPWCIESDAGEQLCAAFLPPSDRVVSYHFIVEGECWAKLAGDHRPPVRAHAGDLLVVPQGEAHLMGSDLTISPTRSAPMLAEHFRTIPGEVMRIGYGGGGACTRVVCGFLTCDDVLSNPLLSALPRLFAMGVGNGIESTWLLSALGFATAEAARPQTGTATVLAKLAELLFVEAVRRCVDNLPENECGWLAALKDRYIGRALSQLHTHPRHDWTVEELAAGVGLSRSAFAQRFTGLLGRPPMQYLAGWRMRMAAGQLRAGGQPLAKVAEAVGYESEAAFSRAFKREFGEPPAVWRARYLDRTRAMH